MSTPQKDFLYRHPREKWIMWGLIGAMALLWGLPLMAAIARGFAFNGVQNFVDVIFGDIGGITLGRTYFNTLVIALLHAFFVVLVSALAGYGFYIFVFRFNTVLYFVVLVFLAVPATSILIPLFFITKELGLRDNYFAVALPEAALTLPFGVLLVRNFAEEIPRSLIEVAAIDGASHPRIWREIFLPICKPALINIGALSMMWSSQDFLFPSLFFSDPEMTTAAQAVLRFKEYLGSTPDDVGKYNASLVLLAVPALLIVLFGLRFITNGLTAGGVKE